MVAASTTAPCTRAAIAIVGYRGSAPLSLWPSITPEEMANFLEGATCTCGGAALPMESGNPVHELPPSLARGPSPMSAGGGWRSAVAMLWGVILGGVNGFAKAAARVATLAACGIEGSGGAGGAGAASNILSVCLGRDAG